MTAGDANSRDEIQHNLLAARAGEFGNYLSAKEITNKSLEHCWRTFQNNIESVRVMAHLPQEVVFAAIDHLLTLSQATFNVLGKPVMEDDDLHPNRDATSAEYSRIKDSFFDGRREVIETFERDLFIYNSNTLVNSPLNKAGFFALLEAIVIGVWTAFDELTSTLVFAAIDANPKAMRSFTQKEVQLGSLMSDEGVVDWGGRKGALAKKLIPLQTHSDKEDIYRRIFGNRIDRIMKAKAVKAARCVRNLIIHDGGITTMRFNGDMNEVEADPWRGLAVGQRIPLNGDNVAELAEELIESANELIRFVDGWIPSPGPTDSKSPAEG